MYKNIMSEQVLMSIIDEGESSITEFKASFQKEVIETVVAFANTRGGKILIGVSDEKSVIGVKLVDETLQNLINTIKQNTTPSLIVDIDPVVIDGKTVLVMQVDEYPIKPVAYKGRYFKRRQNSNHQMSPSEIADAHMKMLNSSWDCFIDPQHDINDISEAKVQRFIKMAKLEDDVPTIYKKYELVKKQQITFGCYLLFTNNDSAILTTIEVGRFATETVIKDGATIQGDLFSEIDKVIAFIQKHINKAYIITGNPQREERWDYPLDAIREIVINMIAHRDYRHTGHSTVKIFDDRIEFFNHGKLPDEMTIDMITSGHYKSVPRNLQIANVFKQAEIIEKYGSGIKRVIEAFQAYGLKKPLFTPMQGGLCVTVFKELVDNAANEEVESSGINSGGINNENGGVNDTFGGVNSENGGVNDTFGGVNNESGGVNELLIYVQNNPGKKSSEIAEGCHKSLRTIERQLKQLKDDGRIVFKGAPKNGGYFVK